MPLTQGSGAQNSVSASHATRRAKFPRHKIKIFGGSYMSALPLSGIKILDLTRVLAGPLSAQMMADLGAEVIKIERPGGGDDARAFGPPYLTDPEGKANNNNSFYLCANRGKKSVTVNIASPEGQEIIRELAKSSDIMMENFKVGDLKRYKLDYESIRSINPGIIYCSVTGFGQTGPYAPRAGYDAIFQAMGGLMSVTGHMDGEPGAGPMKVGPSIVDYMTGMNTSIGILAALYHRKANGRRGPAHRCLPAGYGDRLAVSLRADLPRQRQHAAATRHLGQWRHAGGGVPLQRRRVDAGGRQRCPVRANLRGSRQPGTGQTPEIRREQRPRGERQGDHGDLCRIIPEANSLALVGRAGESRRALRPRQRFRAGVRRPARARARHGDQGQPPLQA